MMVSTQDDSGGAIENPYEEGNDIDHAISSQKG